MIEFIKHINFFEWLKFYKITEKDDFNKNYRPVEYLQSDGNQYIITPFYYDVGSIGTAPIYNIKCRCCINDNYSIFGIYKAFNLTGSSGKMRFYGYTERQNLLTDINTGTELNNWELLNKNLYCNGIIQNTTPDYFNNTYGFGGGDYIYLFGRAGLDDNGGNCKISNFYVSAKNPNTGTITEICDLVACIRKSDNKPGMYDKVSQTFLTNQGTGEFEIPIYGYLSGNPPFTFNSNGNPLVDYTISGNTVQSSTPTPDNPIIPEGCGDFETVGAKVGQYKIPISSAGQTTPVYLGEVETTRMVRKLVLTGEENWGKDSNKDNVDDYFYTDIILDMSPSITPISSHFVSGEKDVVDSVWATGTTVNPRVVLEISKSYTGITSADDKNVRLAKFKSYLAAQYAAGTPVTVWYVLTTEETGIVNEPLMKIGDYADTISKAQAGVEIPTINGSNTLTVDTSLQPSEVSIVYEK